MADLTGQKFEEIFPKLVQIDGTLQNSAGASVFPSLFRTAGINFNASGGDTLSSYEIGTWTPAWSFSTSGSATISITYAFYIKLNNDVFVACRTLTSSIDTPTGDAFLQGLPFTPNALQYPASIGLAIRFATAMPNLKAFFKPNTSAPLNKIGFNTGATNSSSATNLQGSDFNSGSNQNILTISGWYRI